MPYRRGVTFVWTQARPGLAAASSFHVVESLACRDGRQIEKILGHYIADGMHRRHLYRRPGPCMILFVVLILCQLGCGSLAEPRPTFWVYHATVLQ